MDPDAPLPLDGAGLVRQLVHDGFWNHLAKFLAGLNGVRSTTVAVTPGVQ